MSDSAGNKSSPADALIAELLSDDVDGLSLHALLGDKEVKTALIVALRDEGVPLPGLVYRLLVLALGGCERFLGGAIRSRLEATIDRSPQVAGLIQNLVNLRHGAKAQDNLKVSLLEALRIGTRVSTDIEVDEASSLELVIALHTARGLDQLSDQIEAVGKMVIEAYRSDLAAAVDHLVKPDLRWPAEAVIPEKLSAFDRLKYTSGIDPFVGRKVELDLLRRFAGDPSFGGRIYNFRWMLLTGPGGEGKTRLAYEFTLKHLGPFWYCGKLDLAGLRCFAAPHKWRPVQPTFIVIDYAQTVPDDIHLLLVAFSSNSHEFEFPVRLLLLERSADGSWTDKVLPENADKPAIAQHGFANGIEGTSVTPLFPDAIIDLMSQRFEQARVETPSPEALLNLASNVDPRYATMNYVGKLIDVPFPRALFAIATADAIIDALQRGEDPPERLDREEVLADIIKRDRDTLWSKAVEDEGLRRRYEVGFAIATLVQGMTLSDLTGSRFGNAIKWLPPIPPDHDLRALSVFGYRDGHWPPMEPDILGEFFFSEILLDDALSADNRAALLNGAFSLNGDQPATTFLRLAGDFPNRFKKFAGSLTSLEIVSKEMALTLAGLAIGLSGNIAETDISAAVLSRIFRNQQWAKDPQVVREIARAAFNIANYAGGVHDWQQVDAMFAHLDSARRGFPKDQEIALVEAQAARNVTRYAGEANNWQLVEVMLERLDALRNSFPEHREIILREAGAAVNIAASASRARDRQMLEAMLNRVDVLRKSFPKDQEIALEAARAAFNIAADASKAYDWEQVETMLARLDLLRQSFPQDRAIALVKAMAALNISNDASQAHNWQRVEAILARLDVLRRSFPEDRKIALREAQAAFNIVHNVDKVHDWQRVEAMLARLDGLRRSFPRDREIALAEAKASYIIAKGSGRTGDWQRVEAMLVRLDTLFPDFVDLSAEGPDGSPMTLQAVRDEVAALLHGKP
ncbi:MAG: hypothetical protein AAGE61_20805 [Pseudomonadota bacterium]